MSVEWNRFWCRVLFKEFIKHFRKLNDEQIVKDVRQSMDDLEDLVPDTDSFGSQMVRWSLERADEPFAVAARENGKKGGRPRKDLNGDAGHREAPDESATVSTNMRRVPQNEAPAHGFSGGRTAQGTMSRSPEAAAQSGKDYDQEACQLSTDEARQSQALVSRRTGGRATLPTLKECPSVRSQASFRNKEDFIQWAIDDGLDPVDANECWEATEERQGKDADGNTVKNMKAFARQWCRTRANNRRTA